MLPPPLCDKCQELGGGGFSTPHGSQTTRVKKIWEEMEEMKSASNPSKPVLPNGYLFKEGVFWLKNWPHYSPRGGEKGDQLSSTSDPLNGKLFRNGWINPPLSLIMPSKFLLYWACARRHQRGSSSSIRGVKFSPSFDRGGFRGQKWYHSLPH